MRLRFIETTDIAELENYPLSEEQLRFTAPPLSSIEQSVEVPERHPIVIEDRDRVVGFFVLHTWDGPKEFSDNKNSILLRSYSVHPAHQGKGIAKRSMELLPAFVKVHFPAIDEIVLAVNYQNYAAQHVYTGAGFKDTGKRVMGRSGEQFVLSYLLS